jgi:hypothetical protein
MTAAQRTSDPFFEKHPMQTGRILLDIAKNGTGSYIDDIARENVGDCNKCLLIM